jgi:uncharacterized protein YqgC (DUF456 family)
MWTLLAAMVILTGFVGVVFPALPGLPLIWAGVALWAVGTHTTAAWICLGICAVIAAAGMVAQYVLPGRRMAERGVPRTTLLVGALLGVIGFFLIPVVGLLVGFVAGVFLTELARLGSTARAWPSTKHALAAVGWSMLIEFLAGLLVTAVWVGTLVLA